uniref:ATP synthase peripheral stalk subunit d n=1 Tax=Pipistrellus kuhlii TaxID=59472 RepID=A0A7J7SE45_PIPKU|nr:ATP synthase peripheral stalk subunit d [Pipistrellus kuhlii]
MRTSPPGWQLSPRNLLPSTGLTTRPMWRRPAWWMSLRRSLTP